MYQICRKLWIWSLFLKKPLDLATFSEEFLKVKLISLYNVNYFKPTSEKFFIFIEMELWSEMVNRSVRFYFARDGHVIVEVFNLPVSEHSSVGWSNFLHFCLATLLNLNLRNTMYIFGSSRLNGSCLWWFGN